MSRDTNRSEEMEKVFQNIVIDNTTVFPLLVANECTQADFYQMSEYLICRRRNHNISRHARLLLTNNGSLFIRKVPSAVQGKCNNFVCCEIACMNVEISGHRHRPFKGENSGFHTLPNGAIVEPDYQMRRTRRRRANFFFEMSYSANLNTGIEQSVQYLSCPHARLVLFIYIFYPLSNENIANREVEIVAMLFEKGHNDGVAPTRVIYFGNSLFPQAIVWRNQLITQHFPQHAAAISFEGFGLDLDAPPCNDRGVANYLLELPIAHMLADDDGNLNLNQIQPQLQNNLAALQKIVTIDLYELQLAIRLGLYQDHVFPEPFDPVIADEYE